MIEEFLKTERINKFEDSNTTTVNSKISDLIDELRINMNEDELIIELKKLALQKLIDRINTIMNNNVFSKFAKFFDPSRPSDFLYYIIQLIELKLEQNKDIEIDSYKNFLIDCIENYPIYSSINLPLFIEKNKQDFIDNIKFKLNEEDCEVFVLRSSNIREILEEKMTIRYMKANNLKSKLVKN